MNNLIDKLFGVSGKVVLITGASGQLGLELCSAFVSAGSVVIGIDISNNTNIPGSFEFIQCDITRVEDVQSVISSVFKKYKKIDVLVNNAGVSTFEPFEKRSAGSIDYVMDVNLKGTFWCIQTYAHEFEKHEQKIGSIVNVASIYGVVSPDFRIYTDCNRNSSEIYGATKAGVIQMTKYFAVHLASRGIRVNAISPGGIFNPNAPQGEDFQKNYSFRCPLNRMADVSEMVGAIFYFSGNASTYTTGQNLTVDGGLSCW